MPGPKMYPGAFQDYGDDDAEYSYNGGHAAALIIEVIKEEMPSVKDEDFLITIHTPWDLSADWEKAINATVQGRMVKIKPVAQITDQKYGIFLRRGNPVE
eukprot:1585714-Prorocentrum_lima.AAC.1